MDPRAITSSDWASFGSLVTLLWVVVVCNVTFATCLLLAHAAAPSLLGTGHLKPALAKVRPVIYAVGIAALIGTGWAVVSWIGGLHVVYSVYDKRLF